MQVPEHEPPVTSTALIPARQASTELVPFQAAVGAAAVAGGIAMAVTRRLVSLARPLGELVLHPPLLPEQFHPARAVDALAERGRYVLVDGGSELERVVAAVVPYVVGEVLDTLDLNKIVAERVDIDGLVATVDIDEIVSQVDIEAIVDRVDIDKIAASIDLNAIVARLDIDAIVSGVDLDAIVERLNVVELAEDVINEIDLPEIIRESTGSMASEVVRGARVQSIDADLAVNRLVDRILRRRRDRATTVPGHGGASNESTDEESS